ncbi:MAG: hypothetical protein IBJ03_00555 [Gemmatimonadaceae bacterium]|nr:hypothetical protein [Gemmatimonadaceae bacterium]
MPYGILKAGVSRAPWRTGVLATAFALAAVPSLVQAQRDTRRTEDITHMDSVRADGSIKKVMLPARGTGFNLFAAEDIAVASLRSTGGLQGGFANQGGPVPYNQGGGPIRTHYINGSGVAGYVFFEQGFVMAAGRSAYTKILAANPAIRFMRGSQGYTFHFWNTAAAPDTRRIGAADGQFGQLFAGTTGTADGTCRDDPTHAQAAWSSATLLAMKDCPETWASSGFQGKRIIPDSVWRNTFSANPNAFRWDDWKIPASRQSEAFLGTQSTYGYMSDYYREQRLRYGNVVPGQSGAPQVDGFPLGIWMRVDAWQFGSPAVRNAQFYQVTMVNKSADVYGVAIDYDSLYFGLGPGFLMGGAGQHAYPYVDFPNATVYYTKANTSGNCSATYPRRYANTTVGACASTTDRFSRGVYAVTWLKSPLGDYRNKLFLNPESPYYAPNHPNRGDTIMVNHMHAGQFGDLSQNWTRSSRAGFGMLSSKEDDYLDGRLATDFAIGTFLFLFRPEDWSGSLPTTLAETKFAKFVPSGTINPKTGQPFGNWDYNHDGVPDTISMVGCGRQGCADMWSDTVAGGYYGLLGNIGNTVSAGPFPLKANDTTQFLWAFSWTADSLSMRQNIQGILGAYNGNYDGPEPYSMATGGIAGTAGSAINYSITTAALNDSTIGSDAASTVGAQIVLRFPQINAVDQYFLRQIARVRQDSANGDQNVRRILRLNPGLLDRLTARANDNLSGVYVFKSCDNGQSFTTTQGNSATCTAAPTRSVDTGVNPFPWRPWTQVLYTNGIPASATVSETVQAGRSYLYSFVTRSRGFADFRVIDTSATGGFTVTDVSTALRIPADTINSALSTSGPSTVNVYMPISDVAGKSYARIDTATIAGTATQQIAFSAPNNNIRGTSRMYFANRFIVRKTVDTLTSAATTQVIAQWVLPRAATSATGTPVTNFVASERTFAGNLNIPVRNGTSQISGTFRSIAGSSRVFVDTLNAPAGRPGFAMVDSLNRPIIVTSDAYGTAGTPSMAASMQNAPNYQGFVVALRDSAGTNGFRLIPSQLNPMTGTAREFNFTVRAEGDTMTANARQYTPFVSAITGANRPVRGGRYEITWLTDPWGPRAPFRLDPVADLQGTVTASLNEATGRATNISSTTAADAAIVGRTLRRARVPFTVTFISSEGTSHPVRLAAFPRPAGTGNTRLLGSGTDTVRVAVADSVWLPGDTVAFLHNIERDSTVGTGATAFTVVAPRTIDGITVNAPVAVQRDSVGARVGVQCGTGGLSRPAADVITCNPLVLLSRGATTPGNQTSEALAGGYLPVQAGWKQVFELTRAFDPRSVIRFTATPFTALGTVTKRDMERISVVPNPYLVRSNNDQMGTSDRNTQSRIQFIGVPPEGTLSIFSVSGQFLQKLTWTASDLQRSGNDSPNGDLSYDLRTREGLELASGLYLYVLTATGEQGGNQVHRGKFVIIR